MVGKATRTLIAGTLSINLNAGRMPTIEKDAKQTNSYDINASTQTSWTISFQISGIEGLKPGFDTLKNSLY